MTLVIDYGNDQIGTHVIVIGVGRYPYLLDGDAPPQERFDFHGGMGQLTSPPRSALKIAEWFANSHKHPTKPLRTLELLISGAPNTFTTPAGQGTVVEAATLQNIEKAVNRWCDYGDHHDDNLLVLYFCGHGVSTGTELSLLAEDFGAAKRSPFKHAVSFWDLHVGMRGCKAKWQCYFLDACQTVSQTYLEQFGDEFAGFPIVSGSPASNLGKVEQPVLLACGLGAKAYGEEGKESFFAQALLSALKGAAAMDNGYGEWEINTARLREGLNAFLERMVERGYGKEQVARDRELTKPFNLHTLDGPPIIPVDVCCGDPDRTTDLYFDCVQGGSVIKTSKYEKEKRIWETELPTGQYDFSAQQRADGVSPPPRTAVPVYPSHASVRFRYP